MSDLGAAFRRLRARVVDPVSPEVRARRRGPVDVVVVADVSVGPVSADVPQGDVAVDDPRALLPKRCGIRPGAVPASLPTAHRGRPATGRLGARGGRTRTLIGWLAAAALARTTRRLRPFSAKCSRLIGARRLDS
jgi:hypothetical protein